MSLMLLEGFDDNLLGTRWITDGNSSWTLVTTQNRAGSGNGFYHNAGSNENFQRRQVLPAEEHNKFTCGFYFNNNLGNASGSETDTNRGTFFRLVSDLGLTYHLGFCFEITGRYVVYRGPNYLHSVRLGESEPNTFVPLSGNYIEIQATLSDTIGTVKMWVDGRLVIDLSGIDTKNGGTKTVFDGFGFWYDQSQAGRYLVDDFYATNGAGPAPYNDRLGDIVVETLLPNGNGASSQFVGSDGNSTDNYLLVDENPHNSDTDYVVSGTDGHIDTYTMADMAGGTTGLLRGVMSSAVLRHEGVGDNARLLTRIGGVNYNGPVVSPAIGYSAYNQLWELSPASGVDWTKAELNAAEFGVENRP